MRAPNPLETDAFGDRTLAEVPEGREAFRTKLPSVLNLRIIPALMLFTRGLTLDLESTSGQKPARHRELFRGGPGRLPGRR